MGSWSLLQGSIWSGPLPDTNLPVMEPVPDRDRHGESTSMAKWQSVLLGVAGLAVVSASASAQGNRTIGGGPYGGQTVGGSGGLTGSSIGTAGGSGYGPTITNP